MGLVMFEHFQGMGFISAMDDLAEWTDVLISSNIFMENEMGDTLPFTER